MKGNIKVPLWGKVAVIFFIALLGGVMFWVIHINIIPYQKLANSILRLLGSDSNSGFGFLRTLPGMKGIFNWLTSFSSYLIGIVLFVLIQLAELASKIIYRIPWILKKVLAYKNGTAQYKPTKGDKGVERRVKKALSGAITWAIAHLENIRKTAYVIDACVCFAAYPFVKDVENPFDFLAVIFTAQIDRIDLLSLLLFSLTVYGVELLLDTIWSFWELVK